MSDGENIGKTLAEVVRKTLTDNGVKGRVDVGMGASRPYLLFYEENIEELSRRVAVAFIAARREQLVAAGKLPQ